MADPRIGILPEDDENVTGSPALAGMPSTITGATPNMTPVPRTSSAAPLPGGSDVGAPLSSRADTGGGAAGLSMAMGEPIQEGQQELAQQLVPDRGGLENFMGESFYRMGPDATLRSAQESYEAVRFDTGQMAEMDATEREESAERFNQAVGLADGEQQRMTKEKIARDYMATTEQMVEEERLSEEEKDKKDEQFTKFLGGMSRQEFGMFLFDWGARMMANTGQGWAGAGAATMGALGGLQERRRFGAQQEIEAQERERVADLEEREMRVKEREGALSGAEGWTDREGNYRVPKIDPETREVTWEIARDSSGQPIPGEIASNEYRGEKVWLQENAPALGISEDELRRVLTGTDSRETQAQNVREFLMRSQADERERIAKLPAAVLQSGIYDQQERTWVRPNGERVTKPLVEMEGADYAEYAEYVVSGYERVRAETDTYSKYRSGLDNAGE